MKKPTYLFRFRSTKLSNYPLLHRQFSQICYMCLDNKRYIFLSLILLFVIPTFYAISNISVELAQPEERLDVCPKLLDILFNSNHTLCSTQAARRGSNQHIISISIFGPKENQIFADDNFSRLITPFLAEAKLFFPTWTIRLYSDQSGINRLNLTNLSRFATNIDICNVNQLPILGNVGDYLAGKLWRFLPALDPTVNIISSRDLDSPFIEREVAVMNEFINSSSIFLALRDHPLHDIEILGGLWSAYLSRNRPLFFRLFSILLDKTKVKRYILKNDQLLLKELVWPYVKDRTLAFDSYLCGKYPAKDERSFPTQRTSRECHLGCVRPCCERNRTHIALQKPCPIKCRPKTHQDWHYC